MFEKTIENSILKHLPGIEARIQAMVAANVADIAGKLSATQGMLSAAQTRIAELEERLKAEQGGINELFHELSEKITDIGNTVDGLPSEEDIITLDTFNGVLRNEFDADDYDLLTKTNFDPSDFDLVTSDANDFLTGDDVAEKVVEAITDDSDVQEALGELLAEKLSQAFKK